VPTASRPYDQRQESPANSGNVVGLRPPPWEWSFETDGALALSPEPEEKPRSRLKAVGTSASVPRMAQPQAPGLAYRAAERQAMRAKVRRARRTAALAVVACVCLVVLLLTAFGSGRASEATNTGPAPTSRLLPAGPPRAQIVALQDTLRLQLPINQSRVTAIGYHSSGTSERRPPQADCQPLLRRLELGDPLLPDQRRSRPGDGRPRRRRPDRNRRLRTG
jgi:hypothetical protein